MKIKYIGIALMLGFTVIAPAKAAENDEAGRFVGGVLKGLMGPDGRNDYRNDERAQSRFNKQKQRVGNSIESAQDSLNRAKADYDVNNFVQTRNDLQAVINSANKAIADINR